MLFYCTVLLIGWHFVAAQERDHDANNLQQGIYLPTANFIKFTLFSLGDVNDDNKLTFDEFLHTDKLLLKDILETFSKVDKNIDNREDFHFKNWYRNDSFVSKKEYVEWFLKEEAEYKKKVEKYESSLIPPLTVPYQFDTPGVRFARGDANKDGKLAFEEFFYTDRFILDQFRSHFKKMDTNVDGFLSREEFDVYIEKLEQSEK